MPCPANVLGYLLPIRLAPLFVAIRHACRPYFWRPVPARMGGHASKPYRLIAALADCGRFNAAMQLTLQTQHAGDVVIVRCRGRIVSGDEVRFLQLELEKLTDVTRNVVLQLADVTYVDSGGLGALVRIFGVLRAERGDLKMPAFAVRVSGSAGHEPAQCVPSLCIREGSN